MLAVLAKIKNAATVDSSALDSSMAEDIQEVDPKEQLLQVSLEVDKQLTKLSSLVQGASAITPEDREVVINITSEYSCELQNLDAAISELEVSCNQNSRRIDSLFERLNNLVRPQPSTPVSTMMDSGGEMGSNRRLSRFATPLRQRADQSTPRLGDLIYLMV